MTRSVLPPPLSASVRSHHSMLHHTTHFPRLPRCAQTRTGHTGSHASLLLRQASE